MFSKSQLKPIALGTAIFSCLFSGCATARRTVSDVGLAGLGGVTGYELSGGKIGGAAVGAAIGYAASKVAQTEAKREIENAKKEGYERAMNQAVKQQYWIIQNQQRASESPRYVPVQIPAQKIDGVVTSPTIHYIKIDP